MIDEKMRKLKEELDKLSNMSECQRELKGIYLSDKEIKHVRRVLGSGDALEAESIVMYYTSGAFCDNKELRDLVKSIFE